MSTGLRIKRAPTPNVSEDTLFTTRSPFVDDDDNVGENECVSQKLQRSSPSVKSQVRTESVDMSVSSAQSRRNIRRRRTPTPPRLKKTSLLTPLMKEVSGLRGQSKVSTYALSDEEDAPSCDEGDVSYARLIPTAYSSQSSFHSVCDLLIRTIRSWYSDFKAITRNFCSAIEIKCFNWALPKANLFSTFVTPATALMVLVSLSCGLLSVYPVFNFKNNPLKHLGDRSAASFNFLFDNTRLALLSLPDIITFSKSSDPISYQELVELLVASPDFQQTVSEVVGRKQLETLERTRSLITENEARLHALLAKHHAESDEIKSFVENSLADLDAKMDFSGPVLSDVLSRIRDSSLSSRMSHDELSKSLSDLKQEVEETRVMLADMQSSPNEDIDLFKKVSLLENRLEDLVNEYESLVKMVKSCSKKCAVSKSVDGELVKVLEKIMSNDSDGKFPLTNAFMDNIRTKLASRDYLVQQMNALKLELEQHMLLEVNKTLPEISRMINEQLRKSDGGDVESIMNDLLITYDADKTGLFDFALESAGGTIASTRCTRTYDVSTAVYSVWGIPIWWEKTNPRVILQPGSNPGQCWAIQGTQGRVVVRLSNEIYVKAVTLEHIPAILSPDRTITSAPKDFSVYGLRHLDDPNPVSLGNFTYIEDAGKPVQTFYVRPLEKGVVENNVVLKDNNNLLLSPEEAFDLIELIISSNHGNPTYTCIYRFRVHGNLAKDDDGWVSSHRR